MLNKDEFKAKWSSLHSDAETTGIVGGWLNISYRFGLICTLLRISPNALTLFGLLGAVATAITAHLPWAILFLVFSLFCDGIDGSVAIFQHRESKFGATLDSVVDRISEALWFFALYAIGVPAWIPITLWSVAAFQEYARAKIVSLGVSDIGVVTPAERPVRASFLFIVLILNQLSLPGATELSIAFLVLQIYSFISVVRFSRSRLLQ
ncbi:MAG: CDP-alcohol phosphatidyltransferase family protein [Actinobacteria bacterium]|nr:CDP-alcohol phosphatidyltransferase family protein [Actinomycetota bacterium]